MDNYRFFLLALLVTLSYALWQNWQIDYNEAYRRSLSPQGEDFRAQSDQQDAETPTDTYIYGEVPESQASADLPTASPAEKPEPAAVPNSVKAASTNSQRIRVTTDVYHLEIDTTGGDVSLVELLQYPKTKKDPDTPIKILNDGKDGAFFVAQSGLIGSAGIKTPTHRDVFRASASSYTLGDNDVLEVPLVWAQPSGLQVTKIYRFKRGRYEIEVEQTIRNNSNASWSGQQYLQLQRTGLREEDKSFFVRSFTGAVTYTEEDKYRKHEFGDLEDENISEITKDGWIAMIQHYFLSAWIPPMEDVVRIYSKALQNGRYIIGAVAPSSQVNVQPGQAVTLNSQLVVGPKIQKDLEAIANGLELTVDFGVLTFIAKPIFWLLTKFHEFAKNWGIAIILVTFSIKALFFKLSEKSYKSMARMRKLQPKLESLREKFGDDKQRMNMEIMQLYKREKVNPLGGCLPVMVQIPVFISLYWVLLESVELRQAPFFLWIQDLSTKDPYFILPALMGLSMFIQQKLNPTPIDPMQQQIMRLFPVVFTIFFAFFPAGLVLYWVVNNTLSILQQWYITRQIEKAG